MERILSNHSDCLPWDTECWSGMVLAVFVAVVLAILMTVWLATDRSNTADWIRVTGVPRLSAAVKRKYCQCLKRGHLQGS